MYASMLFVVVLVLLVVLVDDVDEAAGVSFELAVVEDGRFSAFLVVTILLIGAISSRKGSSGAGVDVDAFLVDDSVDEVDVVVVVVDVDPISWSMAYHVNNWFLSGAFVEEESSTGRSGSRRSDGRTDKDSRETTLPLPRIIEGGAWGRGSRLSMKTLLVSLLAD